MPRQTPLLTGLPWSADLVGHIVEASAAIARLDARISATPVVAAWQLRAAWSGYARALQLEGEEIDEIDVFAWGSACPLPRRLRRATLDDPFVAFAPWAAQFADNGHRHWREDLGARVAADANYEGPPLVRALEVLRQISRYEPTCRAWLALPLLLQRIGVTRTLLPCLVAGEKRWRLGEHADPSALRRMFKDLTRAACAGLDRLIAIERDRLRAARAIAAASRPGALPRLAARLLMHPVAAPRAIARAYGMTLSGAGKLLARAEHVGLVREVRSTRSWKVYLAPDLAVTFGLADAPRGRPRSEPPPRSSEHALTAVLAQFDADMAAFDQAVALR